MTSFFAVSNTLITNNKHIANKPRNGTYHENTTESLPKCIGTLRKIKRLPLEKRIENGPSKQKDERGKCSKIPHHDWFRDSRRWEVSMSSADNTHSLNPAWTILTDLGHCSRFVRIHREYKLSRMYQKIRCADYGPSEVASQSGPSSTPMGDISSTDSVKQKNPEMRARMFATARSNPKTQWYGRLDIGDKTQQRKTTKKIPLVGCPR